MPAIASSEIKTRIVHQPQKNGDIYVIERKTLYDPEKNITKYFLVRSFQKFQKEQICPYLPGQRGEMGEKSQTQTLYLQYQKPLVPRWE